MASYVVGTAVLFVVDAPRIMTVMMLSYAISTAVVALISTRWKISIHATGVMGPSMALSLVYWPWGLAMFALVSCVIAAVNNIITAAIPVRLRTVGRSGFFAGILNTFCYAGSTLTSFLLGALAERSGWNAVILLLMCALLGLSVVALLFSPYWKKKIVPLL